MSLTHGACPSHPHWKGGPWVGEQSLRAWHATGEVSSPLMGTGALETARGAYSNPTEIPAGKARGRAEKSCVLGPPPAPTPHPRGALVRGCGAGCMHGPPLQLRHPPAPGSSASGRPRDPAAGRVFGGACPPALPAAGGQVPVCRRAAVRAAKPEVCAESPMISSL